MDQLNAYLAATPADQSVFAPLPPRRRQKLIDSLLFGGTGLITYNYMVLKDAMTVAQLHAWHAVFGLQVPRFLLEDARANDAPPLREWPIRDRLQRAKDAFANDVGDDVRARLANDIAWGNAVEAAWQRHIQLQPWHAQLTAAGFNPDELQLLFDANHERVFYRDSPQGMKALREVFDRLAASGQATPRAFRDVYARYIAARQFEQARAFATTYPQVTLPAVPQVQNLSKPLIAGQRRIYRYDIDNNTLIEQAVAIPSTGVLVLSSPACHFSVDAGKAMVADTALRKAMAASQVLWISPQDGDLLRDAALAWRELYPEVTMSPVRDQRDWPEIAQVSTPQFFFYRDGRQVAFIDGWQGEDSARRLRKALQDIGLLP